MVNLTDFILEEIPRLRRLAERATHARECVAGGVPCRCAVGEGVAAIDRLAREAGIELRTRCERCAEGDESISNACDYACDYD